MNESAWEKAKQQVLARWPALTEFDVAHTRGDRDELIALLKERLGYASANAAHDIDQILNVDVPPPWDVGNDAARAGFSSAGEFASRSAEDRPGWSSEMSAGMAWPWPATAAIAALGTLGVTLALRARHRDQRKHLVIPLPTQAESMQAAEVAAEAVGHAAGSGWKYLRSFAVFAAGGIAGWGVRRFQHAT